MKGIREKFILFLLFYINVISPGISQAETNLFWNKSRGYKEFEKGTPEGIKIDNIGEGRVYDGYNFEEPLKSFSLKFRARNLHGNPLKKYSYKEQNNRERKIRDTEWGFFIASVNSDTLWINVSREEIDEVIESKSSARIDIRMKSENQDCKINLKEGLDFYDGLNEWIIIATEDNIKISGGNRTPIEIAEIKNPGEDYSSFGFYCDKGAEIIITDLALTNTIKSSNGPYEIIQDYRNLIPDDNTDILSGFWTIFDRELEEDLLKLGGDYNFALIPYKDGYALVYVSGAKVNKKEWKEGRVKSYFTPTPFPDIFNVCWIDSEGNFLDSDIKAQIDGFDIITINLPYHSSKLRLRKYQQ